MLAVGAWLLNFGIRRLVVSFGRLAALCRWLMAVGGASLGVHQWAGVLVLFVAPRSSNCIIFPAPRILLLTPQTLCSRKIEHITHYTLRALLFRLPLISLNACLPALPALPVLPLLSVSSRPSTSLSRSEPRHCVPPSAGALCDA